MASITEIRQRYPQYSDLSDQQLADGLHQKFYSDMPVADFYDKVGFQANNGPVADALQSAGTGLVKGITGPMAGLPDLANSLLGKTPENTPVPKSYNVPDFVKRTAGVPPMGDFKPGGGIGQDLLQGLDSSLHVPTTPVGQGVERAAEFVPGAALGAGVGGGASFWPNVARYSAIPAGTSEVVGDLAHVSGATPQQEAWARGAGGLTGGIAAGISDVVPAAISAEPAMMARRAFADLVKDSGKDPLQIQRELAVNPNLWPADVMPNARQALMGITSSPGPAKAIGLNAIADRAATLPGQAADAINSAMGMPVDALHESERLASLAKDNARIGFAAALTPIAAVDPSPAIRTIDNMLGPSFQNGRIQAQITPLPWQQQLVDIRQRLTGAPIPNQPGATAIVTDPAQLHQIQSDLYNVSKSLGKQGDGFAAARVNAARQAIIQQIDEASGGRVVNGAYQPGPYRAAQRQFADDTAVREAYAKGYEFDKNRPGLEGMVQDSPAAWDRWMNGAADPQRPWLDPATAAEREALAAGMRSRIEQMQGGARNAIRAGNGPTDGDFNRAKIAMVFGQDAADNLSQDYGALRQMADTHNKAGVAGSMTAERLKSTIGVRPETPPYGQAAGLMASPLGMAGLLASFDRPLQAAGTAVAGAAAGAGKLAAYKIGRAQEMGRNEELARALTMKAPGNQVLIDLPADGAGPTRQALARALAGVGNSWMVERRQQPQ